MTRSLSAGSLIATESEASSTPVGTEVAPAPPNVTDTRLPGTARPSRCSVRATVTAPTCSGRVP